MTNLHIPLSEAASERIRRICRVSGLRQKDVIGIYSVHAESLDLLEVESVKAAIEQKKQQLAALESDSE